jgi:Flp pilus assembly protein TadD
MKNKIHDYIFDPHNPKINFEVAYSYDVEGHIASALSFYLRAAELSNNKDLIYESLIRAGLGFKKQGGRLFSAKSLLYHAINTRPNRPEAYWVLSQLYEQGGEWHEAHNAICIAEAFLKNKKPTITNIGYEGDYVTIFQKAVTIWYVGGRDDARKMFNELLTKYKMTPAYIADTKKNIETIKG